MKNTKMIGRVHDEYTNDLPVLEWVKAFGREGFDYQEIKVFNNTFNFVDSPAPDIMDEYMAVQIYSEQEDLAEELIKLLERFISICAREGFDEYEFVRKTEFEQALKEVFIDGGITFYNYRSGSHTLNEEGETEDYLEGECSVSYFVLDATTEQIELAKERLHSTSVVKNYTVKTEELF